MFKPITIRDFLKEGDLLSTGEIRIKTLAARLRIHRNTIEAWYTRGCGVGHKKNRVVFVLETCAHGGEIRTKPEWVQDFYNAVNKHRASLRRNRAYDRRNGK